MDIILVAPHLEYPPKFTDCRYIIHRYTKIPKIKIVYVLGKHNVLTFKNGKLIDNYIYCKKKIHNNKFVAAFNSLIFEKNYLAEKWYISKNFFCEYKYILKKFKPKTVVFSYLYPLIIFKKNNLLSNKINIVCERHNDDVNWFSSLKYRDTFYLNYFKSPAKLLNFLYAKIFNIICDNSIKWIKNNVKNLDPEIKHIFISKIDKINASKYMDTTKSTVIHPSHDLIQNKCEIRYPEKILKNKIKSCNLLFIGSLSVKMNYDALLFFSKKFYPNIKSHFKKNISVTIVGSSPTTNIIDICSTNNWKLIPNATNNKLNFYYKNSHFSLLPFRYTNGFKIKYIESLVNGLPLLATKNINYLPGNKIPFSIFSDSVDDWIFNIDQLLDMTYYDFYKVRKEIRKCTKFFDKSIISRNLIEYMKK